MKLFIISDTHFGVRNCSHEWLDIQLSSLDWFKREVKKRMSNGDRIVHLGDVFDSRQSIHMRVLDSVPRKFEELSKVAPIDIILGNHDCHDRNTNDINSVEPTLGMISNIQVYREPTVVKYGKRSFGLMPWRYGEEKERHEIERKAMDELSAAKAEVLFAHTDMKGADFNPWRKIEDGCVIDDFLKFKLVFSGHIHHRQKYANVIFAGPPYSMTRSDIGNHKGFWILDTETLEYEFIRNKRCPEFLKLDMDLLLGMTIEEVERIVQNNFVDVVVDFHKHPDFPYQEFVRMFEASARSLFPVGAKKAEDAAVQISEEDQTSTIDVLRLSDSMIDSMDKYNSKVKDKLKKQLHELYARAISQKGSSK